VQSLFGECSTVKSKKTGKHFDVWGMMFAGVVGAIENTLVPKILELVLWVLTFKPMKALIH
jgi:hypothetical protein